MNTTLIVLALVAAAYAMPQLPKIIPVVSKSFVQDSVGQFTFEYESGDGTKYKESGRLVPNANGTDNVLVKEGVVSYTSPEGIPVTLTYKADTLGFRPTGDHLPVPVVV